MSGVGVDTFNQLRHPDTANMLRWLGKARALSLTVPCTRCFVNHGNSQGKPRVFNRGPRCMPQLQGSKNGPVVPPSRRSFGCAGPVLSSLRCPSPKPSAAWREEIFGFAPVMGGVYLFNIFQDLLSFLRLTFWTSHLANVLWRDRDIVEGARWRLGLMTPTVSNTGTTCCLKTGPSLSGMAYLGYGRFCLAGLEGRPAVGIRKRVDSVDALVPRNPEHSTIQVRLQTST